VPTQSLLKHLTKGLGWWTALLYLSEAEFEKQEEKPADRLPARFSFCHHNLRTRSRITSRLPHRGLDGGLSQSVLFRFCCVTVLAPMLRLVYCRCGGSNPNLDLLRQAPAIPRCPLDQRRQLYCGAAI